MRIAILSRNPKLYSTARLRRVAEKMGHDVKILDTLKFDLLVENPSHRLYYQGKELEEIDVVLPRIGASITNFGLAVVRQFEMSGIPVINSSRAYVRSRDKMRSLQKLSISGVPIARTVMTRNPSSVGKAIDLVGGAPVILKLLHGTHGVGVILAESKQSAESTIETIWSLGEQILIQQYIGDTAGSDIRAFIVGGKVIAAMRRRARPGEFRSNIHRGAIGEPVQLSRKDRAVALKAADVFELEIAGVDMLETPDGPVVMEVNPSPGFEGLERATKIDVASKIIKCVMKLARTKPKKAGI